MATTIDAKIRLAAQFDGALRALRDLRREVVGVNETVNQRGGRPFPGLTGGLSDVAQQIKTVRQQLLGLIGIQVGVQGVQGVSQLVDGYAAMSARLRIATKDQAEYNAALDITRTLAKQYQQPLRETTDLYTRQLAAIRPLGGGLRETAVATEALLASLKISGATAAESGSAILQFSQAMGAGALRGEEFNAMAEAAPRLLQALADGLGKPRGELKLLAEQGQLTTAVVMQALQKQLPALQREAAKIPTTLGGAWQHATDKLREYVGTSAEGSAGTKAITSAIRTLADNISLLVDGIVLLAGAWAAVKIGAVVGGVVQWAAALTSVSGAAGVLTVALRGLLALVGGPVGLIAALASLVIGYNALADAKQKAAGRTVDAVQAERDAIQAETEQLREQIKLRRQAGQSISPSTFLRLRESEARLRRLDAELQEQQQKYYDQLRANAGPRGGPGTSAEDPGLRDPAAIRRFQDEYKLRADIVKKFELERKQYTVAIDREIAAARARGDETEARRLEADRRAYLAEQAKAEQEALRKYNADQVATRIAQLKDRFDAELELLRDRLDREQTLNQERYDAGLRDAASYLAEKRRLNDESIAAEISALQQELEGRRRVQETNQARLRQATSANDREQINEALYQQQQEVLRLETEIERKTRDRADAARAIGDEEARITAELQRQLASIDSQLKQAFSNESFEDIARRVQEQFRPMMEKIFQDGGDTSIVQRLVDVTVLRESFAKVERDYQQMLANLKAQEEAVNLQAEAGAISRLDAERKIIELRAAQLPELQKQADLLKRIGSQLGPSEQTSAQNVANQIQGFANLQSQLEKTARSAGAQGLSNLFVDIASRAKTAKEAALDFVRSFAQSMLDMIAKRLGQQLIESMLPAGGAGGAGGGGGWVGAAATWIASFFHTGGVVGAGSGMKRAIAVSPAAIALAPRYHGGGIAGLKPNERLSVLEDGEEVLTEDNPRHIKNAKRNLGGVVVHSSVTVNGADGTSQEQQQAGEELQAMIDSSIEQWAVTQSRPNGILYRGA